MQDLLSLVANQQRVAKIKMTNGETYTGQVRAIDAGGGFLTLKSNPGLLLAKDQIVTIDVGREMDYSSFTKAEDVDRG